MLNDDPANSFEFRFAQHTQCEALSASLRGKLCARLNRGPALRLQPGEHLYRAGSVAQSIYLVQSGVMKSSMVSVRGEELTVRLYRAGDTLGELCLCEGVRQETSRVVEVPLPILLRELQGDPESALELAATVCRRLSEAYRKMGSLATDPVSWSPVCSIGSG